MGYSLVRKEHEKALKKEYEPLDPAIQQVTEKSDIAETIKELNSDIVDKDKFSGIDMKANLHPVEISAILCVDTLISMEFLPLDTAFLTRKKQRLSASKMGEGRNQIVSIAQGMRDQNSSRSFGERFSSLFTGGRS